MATIITIHIAAKDAAAAGHVCPGIRIHAIDIVQPPGIGIPPIADMEAHQSDCQRRADGEEQRGDGGEGTMGSSLGSRESAHAAQMRGSKWLAKEVV